MSIEVADFDPADRRYVNTISAAGGILTEAHGIESQHAYTTGVLGAEYGVAVALTTLRQMGIWPPQDFDPVEFEVKARQIVDASIETGSNPSN